jgi:hypothetical protein
MNMAISIVTGARNSNLSWNIWVLLWDENKLYLFNLECYKAVSTVDSFLEILYLSRNPFFLLPCLPSRRIQSLNSSDRAHWAARGWTLGISIKVVR